MTDETPAEAEPGSRRRLWTIIVLSGVAVLAILGVILQLTLNGNGTGPGGGTADPTASPTRSSSPTADPTPSPTASTTPPGATDAPGEPVGEPGEEVPAAFDSAPAAAPGLAVAVVQTNAIEGTADAPGEIAGPAVQFVVEFRNSTDQPISLTQVAINSDYGSDRTPALELTQEESEQVPDEVGPGQSVTGSYVYNIPLEERDLVRLLVFTNVDNPVVAFEGSVPR